MANYENTYRARPAGKGKWEVAHLGPFPGREYIETVFTGTEAEAASLAESLNGPVETAAQQAAAEANQTEEAQPASSPASGGATSTEQKPTAEATAADAQTETPPEAIPTEGTRAARKSR